MLRAYRCGSQTHKARPAYNLQSLYVYFKICLAHTRPHALCEGTGRKSPDSVSTSHLHFQSQEAAPNLPPPSPRPCLAAAVDNLQWFIQA